MRRAYSQIFWGLLIDLIDFRFNGFDLLPDVIGYALILAGLTKLRPHSRGYRIAWIAAVVLLLLSALQLFGVRGEISLTGGEGPEAGALGLVSLALAANMVFFYGICDGIRQSALERRRLSLAGTARSLWYWNFAIGAMTLFSFPFQLNYEPGVLYLVFLLLALGSFMTGLLLVLLVRRAGRELTRPVRRPPDEETDGEGADSEEPDSEDPEGEETSGEGADGNERNK
ncbi:hypothetical protein J19TS2_43070 [Cohnella xylanilytica]|nr:hypothetical protein J19TS2_43070 [Cohnella xylanilytica]